MTRSDMHDTSEHPGGRAPAKASLTAGPYARGGEGQHHGRYHHRVRDVMTRAVVTVDRMTPYKEITALMAEHKISAVPVLTSGRHITGVVSEADLLRVLEKHARAAPLGSDGRLRQHAGKKKHLDLTAGELMTSPAVTIHPDATLPTAARLMNSSHVKRLPVVDSGPVFGGGVGGNLIGIVSRCDLLSVFLRPDEDIAWEVRQMLTEILLADPARVTVHVRNGIVTLTGQVGSAEQHDLIGIAVRLTLNIDGVVDVVNKLGASITPCIPVPDPPHSGTPLNPGEFVATAYGFTEQMLTSQRKFAEKMVEATKPLFGIQEDAAATDDDTT
jgi:CBS-domain-containing membrane protein